MTTDVRPTFEVDKEGLRKLLAKRGAGFALFELVQNAWDEDVTRVDVTFDWDSVPSGSNPGLARIVVEDDDPEGFTDLAHAYTLFAESEKKSDAEKRGRFNLGEKLVIAVCEAAVIETTTGTIHFDARGRVHSKPTRKRGSRFTGYIHMTTEEFDAAVADVRRLIPPADIATYFNGERVPTRKPLKTFQVTLPTEAPNAEGVMRRTLRKTDVSVYEPTADEEAGIYEMGIPVVATGDRWHADIGQKVPLNLDRDNVTPEFLREVRVAVLNNCADILDADDADATWVTQAAESPKAEAHAVKSVITARFGEKVVKFDPSDPEANARAVAAGYTVIASRSLPKGIHDNIKRDSLALPAGQVTPGHHSTVGTGVGIAPKNVTPGMANVAEFAKAVALRILGVYIQVEFVDDPQQMNFAARYGQRTLEFNYRVLGKAWFDGDVMAATLDRVKGKLSIPALVVHELAHERVSNHLSTAYYDELTNLGTCLASLALEEPEFFAPYRAEVTA